MPEICRSHGAGDVEAGQVPAVAAAQPSLFVGQLGRRGGMRVRHGSETTGSVTPLP